MAEKAQYALNKYDFFTVDLNEELSAFNGGLLVDQSEFVTDCINKILSLYTSPCEKSQRRCKASLPTTVVLLGHSMGGMVARSVFLSPTYKNGTVRTILTLSTPHRVTPVAFRRDTKNFYTAVNDFWQSHCKANQEINDTAIISISGGWRDNQVQGSYANLHDICPGKQVSVVSTSVPDVWLSTDHQSCMWCKQLMQVMSGALASLIDPQTRQVSENLARRLSILRTYFEPAPFPPALGFIDTKKAVTSTPTKLAPIAREDIPALKDFVRLDFERSQSLLRLSIRDLSSKFQIKWSLTDFSEKNTFQLATTVPLDDVQVFRCDSKECLDVTPDALLLPYQHHAVGHRHYNMLKVVVISLNLQEHSHMNELYLMTTPSESNRAVYRGDYGNDVFLVAQLQHSSASLTAQPTWGSLLLPLHAQSILSNVEVQGSSKYCPLIATVDYHDCQVKTPLQPYIMEFVPAMKEIRFGLSALSLRYHEQYLVTYDSQQEASNRIKSLVKSINVLVIGDPSCAASLSLQLDWKAMCDIFLRSHAVSILGCVLCLVPLLFSFLLEAAPSNHSGLAIPSLLQLFSRLLTSKRAAIVLVACLTSTMLGPLLDQWLPTLRIGESPLLLDSPSPVAVVVIFAVSISFLVVFGLISQILFALARFCPGSRTTEVAELPPLWRLLLLPLALLLPTVLLHSSFSIIFALLWLVCTFTRGPSAQYYKQGVFLFAATALLPTLPDFVVWLQALGSSFRIWDDYEAIACILVVHIALLTTAPSQAAPIVASRFCTFTMTTVSLCIAMTGFSIYLAVDSFAVALLALTVLGFVQARQLHRSVNKFD